MARVSLGIALFLCTFACKSPQSDDAADGETTSETDGGETATSETGGDETCPLTPSARQLVAEMVTDLVAEISWVTVHSVDPREAPFALSLVGTPLANLGSAFLIDECTAPLQYDAYCEPDGGVPDLWRCSRLGCEDADVRVIELWFAPESTLVPDAPGAIAYPLEGLSGEGHYDPGPVRRWRLAQVGEMFETTTSFEHFARAELDGGEIVELRHVANITGTANLVAPQAATISVMFPEVALDGLPVALEVTLDEHGDASGTIEHEGTVLADVETVAEGSAGVVWNPPCD